MHRSLAWLWLALLPCQGSAAAAPPPTTRPSTRPETRSPAGRWRVHALEYGRSSYPASLINGASKKARRVDLAWLFYLLRNGRRTILVDTGFIGRRWVKGLSHYADPRVLLARLQLHPKDITDVVLTHGHFDHAGGLALFPKARIWLGEREARAIERGAKRGGRLARLQRWLERQRRAGRRELVGDKSRSLAPGLTLEQVGGHSPGSVVLWLAQPGRRCVFVGDECYLRAACRHAQPLPPKSRASRSRNLRLLRRIAREMRKGGLRVYSGHDPAVLHEGEAKDRAAHVVPVCQSKPSSR